MRPELQVPGVFLGPHPRPLGICGQISHIPDSMQTLLARYENSQLGVRLAWLILPAVLLNAGYCIAYSYYSGHSESVSEAVLWGVINIAPWIAAIELGRHLRGIWPQALLIAGAVMISLGIEAAYMLQPPSAFDLVRRIPGAGGVALALAGLALYRGAQARKSALPGSPPEELASLDQCSWVRSAGNYVEVFSGSAKPRLIRSSLAACVAEPRLRLVRIHRSYAVASDTVAKIERGHVRLTDGKRLPIGDRFRGQLKPFE